MLLPPLSAAAAALEFSDAVDGVVRPAEQAQKTAKAKALRPRQNARKAPIWEGSHSACAPYDDRLPSAANAALLDKARARSLAETVISANKAW